MILLKADSYSVSSLLKTSKQLPLHFNKNQNCRRVGKTQHNVVLHQLSEHTSLFILLIPQWPLGSCSKIPARFTLQALLCFCCFLSLQCSSADPGKPTAHLHWVFTEINSFLNAGFPVCSIQKWAAPGTAYLYCLLNFSLKHLFHLACYVFHLQIFLKIVLFMSSE